MLKWLRNFAALFTGKPAAALLHELPETIRLLFARRSCRSFNDEPLLDEHIQAILEAGRFAPSTVNLQSWSFITFTREQWHEIFDRPIPFKGYYAVIICADIFRLNSFLPEFKNTPFVNLSLAIFNSGLAAMSMNMAAEALGSAALCCQRRGGQGCWTALF